MAFSPRLLLILTLQPILFHIIVAEGHYMLCSTEEFFFFLKSRAELFDYGVATVMSKVCMVLTPCLRFASSVCFGSFCLASPKTGVASLQEDYRTHQFD